MLKINPTKNPVKKSIQRKLRNTMDELNKVLGTKEKKSNKVFSPNGKDRRKSKGKLRIIT